MNDSCGVKHSLPTRHQRLSNVRPVPGVADAVLLHQVDLPERLVVGDAEPGVAGGPQSADV